MDDYLFEPKPRGKCPTCGEYNFYTDQALMQKQKYYDYHMTPKFINYIETIEKYSCIYCGKEWTEIY